MVVFKEVIKRIRSRWMEGTGAQSDIVISSRVRLARNIQDIPFPHLINKEDAVKVIQKVEEAVKAIGEKDFTSLAVTSLSELDALQKQILVEKHLISPLLLEKDPKAAVALTDEEEISVMINEEDHLRIQCILPALQLLEAWQIANQLDDHLEKQLDFGFDDKFGYVTACPTNAGTGMRASVMLHLPGLIMTKRAGRILPELSKVGLVVRGLYGEGTEALGNLFQISNQITIGRSEEEIINNLASVTQKIVDQEREAREVLKKELGIHLEDKLWRAYGTLRYARLIKTETALSLLSQVRLGVDMEIIKGLDPRVMTELMVMIQPGCLQYIMGQEMDAGMRDVYRARLLRERLKIDNT